MKTARIRLLIIEDNRLLRDGMMAMLKAQKDILVVASSGNSDILKVKELKPNVILLDLGLRSRNSLQVVKILKKEFPKAKVIVMDLAPVEADIMQYVQAGAAGFVLKDATLDNFLSTIRSVAKGEKVLPPRLNDLLFTQIVQHALKGGKEKLKDAVRMTKRELEVIGGISEGLSNQKIGERLRISTYTVKSHIHNVMDKLALHTRLEIANYAFTSEEDRKAVANSISLIKH